MEAYFETPYSAYDKCDREDVFTILPANCTLPISASDTQWPSIARFGIFLLSQIPLFSVRNTKLRHCDGRSDNTAA